MRQFYFSLHFVINYYKYPYCVLLLHTLLLCAAWASCWLAAIAWANNRSSSSCLVKLFRKEIYAKYTIIYIVYNVDIWSKNQLSGSIMAWSYGTFDVLLLCNQGLSPVVSSITWGGVFSTTFCQWLVTGWWFSVISPPI